MNANTPHGVSHIMHAHPHREAAQIKAVRRWHEMEGSRVVMEGSRVVQG